MPESKMNFIMGCVFTGIFFLITLLFGFSEGWTADSTIFCYGLTLSAAIFTVCFYFICKKKEFEKLMP